MKEDIKIVFGDNKLKASFSQEFIEKLSKNLGEKIAKELYYDLLLLKNIPLIEAVKQGKIKALKNKEAEKFLKEVCK